MSEGLSRDPEARREPEREAIYLGERPRLSYVQDGVLELNAV